MEGAAVKAKIEVSLVAQTREQKQDIEVVQIKMPLMCVILKRLRLHKLLLTLTKIRLSNRYP